jgi:hypothetical protein
MEREVGHVPLAQITGAVRNPKRHDGTGIAASIARFGLGELPMLDERTGRLVAGHGRIDQLAAMHAAGQPPPDGIQTDEHGGWLVPVIRGWASGSDAEADAYLVASNQLTVAGGWDEPELAALLAGLAAADATLLAVTGLGEDDLDRLLDRAGVRAVVSQVRGKDARAAGEAVSTAGDVWLCGPHRVACGDATDPGTLALAAADLEPGIVYTDPPYGISCVNPNGEIGSNSALYMPVTGDGTPDTAAAAFALLSAVYPAALQVWWGANHYAGTARLPDTRCWLIWDKDNAATDFADAELAWTNHPGSARLLRHRWNGLLKASERGIPRVHPNQKPVALAVWAFGVIDPKTGRKVVMDVFAGSGSTLIAAHETGRTAVLVEYEPHYVDVICARWQQLSGVKPVLEASGQAYDFTAANTPT